jgi:ketosteroid isomerase-like protein
MLRRGIGVLVASMMVASCSGGSSGPEFGRADGETIRAMVDDYAAAYNAKDVEAIQAMFSGNISLMPPNSSTVRGPESAGGYYSNLFATGESEVELETADLAGEGTLAFAQGTFRTVTLTPAPADGDDDEGEPEDDGEPDEDEGEAEVEMVESRDRGKWLISVRKLGGVWRIENIIWSSDLPVAL